MKKLKEFLKRNNACEDGFDFAKDLTLEEFLNTCPRGDWILWLFAKLNPDSLRELTLAKGHCANTVRHLMEDERSTNAVDVAIAFGEGKATRKELNASAVDAWAVVVNASVYWAASCAARAVSGDADDADIVAARAAYAVWAAGGNYEQNQKQTADICRQYLPLKIWNQKLI